MKLHYREMGEGKPLMILHGLFGYSDNWQSHGKKLAEYYRVILVDLRNHGHSGWSDDFSYEVMAEDVYELCQDLQLEEVILMGHSMGGKVAMYFAHKYESMLNKLVVVDMGIKSYPMHHDHILEGIHAVTPTAISSRGEAEEQMSRFIDSEAIRQFLLKNLYWKEKGQLAWRMNIEVIEKKMKNILAPVPKGEVMIPTLFLRGEFSNYVLDEDLPEIEAMFIDLEVVTIPRSGHWLHAEEPTSFLEALLSFCLR